MNEQEEKYELTEWGCLSFTLQAYAVDISHITPAIGKHMVEDFMDAMVKALEALKNAANSTGDTVGADLDSGAEG